jgi:hypothetical protein
MSTRKSFPMWLRSNSEHYLLEDAQARLAKRTGFPAPRRPRSLKDRFWRQLFAPAYRLLPRSIRRRTIQALPGSHRKDWPKPNYESRKPAV